MSKTKLRSDWETLCDTLGASGTTTEPLGERPTLEALEDALRALGRPSQSNVESRRDFASRVLLALRDNVLTKLDYEAGKPACTALTELLLALHDIDAHGAAPNLFKPTRPKRRRPPSAAVNMRRGIVAALVNQLVSSGTAANQMRAFDYIADRIGLSHVTAKTIRSDFGKRGETGESAPTDARVASTIRACAAITELRLLFSTNDGAK